MTFSAQINVCVSLSVACDSEEDEEDDSSDGQGKEGDGKGKKKSKRKKQKLKRSKLIVKAGFFLILLPSLAIPLALFSWFCPVSTGNGRTPGRGREREVPATGQ